MSKTAPNHFLGDFPNIKWRYISPEIPADLTGATVLDIGCNGGFYCVQMKQRGAERVLGIDVDDRYLNQARFAAEQLNLQIDFQKLSVYDVDKIAGQFDFVLFMGVFYHLRYPLYALDKIIQKVRGRMIFQTMIRGSETPKRWDSNYHFWNKDIFEQRDFPRMYFVENRYADDPTNWWLPERQRRRSDAEKFGTGDRGASGDGDMDLRPARRDARRQVHPGNGTRWNTLNRRSLKGSERIHG